jgi:hypothetical protein
MQPWHGLLTVQMCREAERNGSSVPLRAALEPCPGVRLLLADIWCALLACGDATMAERHCSLLAELVQAAAAAEAASVGSNEVRLRARPALPHFSLLATAMAARGSKAAHLRVKAPAMQRCLHCVQHLRRCPVPCGLRTLLLRRVQCPFYKVRRGQMSFKLELSLAANTSGRLTQRCCHDAG